MFLMHREVVVTKVYALFRLIKVHYAGETTGFYVDACALTAEPNYKDAISIGMLNKGCNEIIGFKDILCKSCADQEEKNVNTIV